MKSEVLSFVSYIMLILYCKLYGITSIILCHFAPPHHLLTFNRCGELLYVVLVQQFSTFSDLWTGKTAVAFPRTCMLSHIV